jgi:hypothetical protein
MSLTANNPVQSKLVTETLGGMLQSSHSAAESHDAANCRVCAATRYERENSAGTKERRDTIRTQVHTRVTGDTGRGKFETGMLDLSTAGAFLESVLPFPVGTPLTLKFKLDSGWITVPSEICYSIEHVGFGVRFVDLIKQDRDRIATYIGNRR